MNKSTQHAIENHIKNGLESHFFQWILITLIIINAIILGLDTNPVISEKYGYFLAKSDDLILFFFSVELALKIITYRTEFFKSGWNIFDLLVVSVSWGSTYVWLSVLRSLRILRVLRLISTMPRLRRLITAVGDSIPSMTAVIGLLILLLYVASVLATNLFGHHNDPIMQEWFGDVGASAFTLFEVMSLNTTVVRTTLDLFPWAGLFFIPYIIISSFAVLNFIIGIIVDSMQNAERIEAEETGVDDNCPATKQDVRLLLKEIEKLKKGK